MIRTFIAVTLLAATSIAAAGELVLNDVTGMGATQLSKEELQQLLPGAKVVSYYKGARRSWKNKADGTLVAGSDARRDPTKIGKQATGVGSWHIGDNGTWCVMIEWPKRTENWCKYLFRADAKYYGVKSLTSGTAEAWEFELSQ
jgi:hypothetical protein